MKKEEVFRLILGLLLISFTISLVSSQTETPSVPGINPASSNIFGITPDSGVKLTEQWSYLGTEWKNILMNNSVFKAVDSFFQSINFLFVILLGTPYSFSVSVFLITILWLFVFFAVDNILKYTLFSKWVALAISFGSAVLLAQIGLFQLPVNALIGLFFGEQPWWIKLIIGIIIAGAIAIAVVILKNFSGQMAINKKKTEEEKNLMKIKSGAEIGEKISKAASKKIK